MLANQLISNLLRAWLRRIKNNFEKLKINLKKIVKITASNNIF